MKAAEFVSKAKEFLSKKTIYVKGAYGDKMTQANKLKFTGTNPYNSMRSGMIFAASDEALGFDEISFINIALGLKKANAMRNIGEIISKCEDISKDFSTIVPGEIAFGDNVLGICIEPGKFVTCIDTGVTEVGAGYFVSHGKFMNIDYNSKTPEIKEDESNDKAEVEVRQHRIRSRY